jgi:hypothetical protein
LNRLENIDIDAILEQGANPNEINEIIEDVLGGVDVQHFNPPRSSTPSTIEHPDSTDGDPYQDGLDDPDRTFDLRPYGGEPPQEAVALQAAPVEPEEVQEPAFLIIHNRHAVSKI